MEKGFDATTICLITMDKTRQIIDKYKDIFPEFQYYHGVIDKIEENIDTMPDVSIESCKTLVEGVSKTILKKFDIQYIEKGRNADTPNGLLKKVLDELSKYSSIDAVVCQTSCSIVHRISELRNERGDISHGKLSPKDINSDKYLAEAIKHITDGVIRYVLNIYFTIDFPSLDEVKYEDNQDFNQFLDDGLNLDISYSKALFDQDIVFYKEQLNNYLSEKEE